MWPVVRRLDLVYDRNHYFGSGLIPKLKPIMADTLGADTVWAKTVN